MSRFAARMHGRRRWAWHALMCAATLGWPGHVVWAASSTAAARNPPLTVGVDLNFAIHIHKFLFFRIGDGAWPNPGGTPSQVRFELAPAGIPGAAAPHPVVGNDIGVNWSGVAPDFAMTATNNVLPVEVRSNTGAVSLRAAVTTALTSGSGQTIPMSAVSISSSDPANLPAPPVPDSGEGAAVTVASSNLVTQRSADWTFSLSGDPSTYLAGTYHGRISFTAYLP